MILRLGRIVTLMLCTSFRLLAFPQGAGDVRSITFDTITVYGHRHTTSLTSGRDGTLAVDMGLMDDLPKILGNADPIHYSQMLPGVQTNAEYQSGIHIQGGESSHNSIEAGGVPIYNVNHLLGFFSTFNAAHYRSLRLCKSMTATGCNRLGGTLSMTPDTTLSVKTGGEYSVGLISSQGTFRFPLGGRTSLKVSARLSYLDLLYKQWLTIDGSSIEYSFYDANATLVHAFNSRDKLVADFYIGSDDGAFFDGGYLASMKARWGNVMGSLCWLREGDAATTRHTLYATSYHNDFSLDMSSMSFRLPSGITDVGYKWLTESGRWNVGADLSLRFIRPQSVEQQGALSLDNVPADRQRPFEGTLHGSYALPLACGISAVAGARATLFAMGGAHFYAVDPSVRLTLDRETVQASMGYAVRHQYIFQTGFSDAGLPTEFWTAANATHRPQYAHGPDISLSAYLFGRRYRITADAFCKWLYNQMEYRGSILDYANTVYDFDRTVVHGRGYNWGWSVMLNKCTGRLNGWVCYSYTAARRHFAGKSMDGWYHASHERPHELNLVATYALSRHWNVCATFTGASGTPFTAPSSLSLVNGSIVSQYAPYNSNRLKPYMRLDLSANYKWRTRGGRECGVNLSLYNATGRGNDLFYRVKVNRKNEFAYRPVSFVVNILPSVSYFCKL